MSIQPQTRNEVIVCGDGSGGKFGTSFLHTGQQFFLTATNFPYDSDDKVYKIQPSNQFAVF